MTTRRSRHRKLCYDTTFWQHLLASKRLESGGFSNASEKLAQALKPALKLPGTTAEQMRAIRPDADDVSREIHSRLYGNPERLEDANSEVPWAPMLHEMLEGMPEWESTRASASGDPDFAAVAATTILESLADSVADLIAASEGDETEDESMLTAEDRLRQQMRAAASVARSNVANGRSALNMMFPKLGETPPHYAQEDSRRMELIERVVRSHKLQKVLRMAGRISRVTENVRAVKDPHSKSDVVNIEVGGDLSRVLPTELAGLMDPALRDLTYLALATDSALQYAMSGKEPLGRGPIALLVDRSGSMGGAPSEWASAAAVALVAQAHKQHRSAFVLEFDDSILGKTSIKRGKARVWAYSDQTDLYEWESATVEEAVLQIATRRNYGGTDFNLAFDEVLQHVENEEPRADVIFLTDGCASISSRMLERIDAQKAQGMRVFGLTIGGGSLSAAVQASCDAAFDLDAADDVGAAMAEAIASATAPSDDDATDTAA